MASLPAFHAFHQAASDEDDGSLNTTTTLPSLQAEAHIPPATSRAGCGSLAIPSAQPAKQEEIPAVYAHGSAGAGNSSTKTTVLTSDHVQNHLESVSDITEDGTLGSTERQAYQNNVTQDQNTVTYSSSFNPKVVKSSDPALLAALQQSTRPHMASMRLADIESSLHSVPELPVVSVDTTSSIIFITMRMAHSILPSVIASMAFAFALNLLYAYPNLGGLAGSATFWVSVLAGVVSTLFLLVSSIRTTIKDSKAQFESKPLHDLSQLPAASYLFVLGSGGHTTEMMALIKLSQKPSKNTHRRYLITAGDKHSCNQADMLEDKMAKSHPDGSAGTSDMVTVTRARAVHQSYITSIYTSLQCFFEIANALINIPLVRAGQPNAMEFRFPHVIVTNGPGTGYIVGLVALFLKVFHVVPRDRLKVVFVETWARAHSLGLTGKLFNLTQIADLFVVQSEDLAKAINKPCIGNVNKKWADLVNATSKNGSNAEQEAE